MSIVLPDYHIHTSLCNHAEGEMEEYVEHAIRIGLKEIGFSDHMPVMPEPHLCMGYDQLDYYIDRVCDIRERYRERITVRLGCEMDIVGDRIGEIEDIIHKYPFDYVIGSIHYLDGWPFDQEEYIDTFENGDVDEIYGRFFDAIAGSIETGLYDIVGHIDNIKCMGYRATGDLTQHYERIASLLKSHDLAVEVNTSGIDKRCKEQYPSKEFLRILCQHDIPVTTGSDSHNPGSVGRYFNRAVSLLEEVGYNHVTYFSNRERILKPLRPSQPGNESGHSTSGSGLS